MPHLPGVGFRKIYVRWVVASLAGVYVRQGSKAVRRTQGGTRENSLVPPCDAEPASDNARQPHRKGSTLPV